GRVGGADVRAAPRPRISAWAVRRGARRPDRAAPGQLPAGVHAPGADQRGDPCDLAGGGAGVRGFGPPAAASVGPGAPVRTLPRVPDAPPRASPTRPSPAR